MNEDRPVLSATELLHTESTFQRCIDYVDIAGHSSTRIYVTCLPLHSLGFFVMF